MNNDHPNPIDAAIRLLETAVAPETEFDKRPVLAQRALSALRQANGDYDPMAGHKCKIIARVSPIGEGREALLGELLEPIPGYPSETHCLHVTTPAKKLVFGITAGDMAALAALAQIVHGYALNQTWLDAMANLYRHRANR